MHQKQPPARTTDCSPAPAGAASSTIGSGNSSGEICSEVSPQPAMIRLLASNAPALMQRQARAHHVDSIIVPPIQSYPRQPTWLRMYWRAPSAVFVWLRGLRRAAILLGEVLERLAGRADGAGDIAAAVHPVDPHGAAAPVDEAV